MAGEKMSALEQFKLEQELLDKYNKRRGEGYFQDVVFVRRGSTRSKPDIFTKRETFSFLQYIRIVMHWAKRNSGLTRPQIEMLLYLQPLGIFKKSDFSYFCRVVSTHQQGQFTAFVDGGWIKKWRDAKPNKKQSALYQLTPKADNLCTRIHKMCIGEENIPESDQNSMTSSEKAIDKYYMQIAKRMNKREE